jgi:beta-ribofuranosylaminobenzene 5'-phosphate synthase
MEIVAGSRLHFGLLHVPDRLEAEGTADVPQVRSFGGAGLMIDAPELRIEAHSAKSWSARGPHAETILAYAQACRHSLGEDAGPPLEFRCNTAPPRHAGFGSGTQLGLSVARLIAEMSGKGAAPVQELARWVKRGKRSAVGAHGFAEGGFIVEAGKRTDRELSPRIAKHAFPEEWPIVIVLSKIEGAIHGSLESQLFSGLVSDNGAERHTEILCRVLLLGVIPALIERDYAAFGHSLYEFNRLAGERFAKAQGGAFASGQIAEIVETLRSAGCPAVGQSSWGPAVFAICSDDEAAARIAVRARQLVYPAEIFVAHATNRGAVLTT